MRRLSHADLSLRSNARGGRLEVIQMVKAIKMIIITSTVYEDLSDPNAIKVRD